MKHKSIIVGKQLPAPTMRSPILKLSITFCAGMIVQAAAQAVCLPTDINDKQLQDAQSRVIDASDAMAPVLNAPHPDSQTVLNLTNSVGMLGFTVYWTSDLVLLHSRMKNAADRAEAQRIFQIRIPTLMHRVDSEAKYIDSISNRITTPEVSALATKLRTEVSSLKKVLQACR